ncbi:MAG: 3-phosphoshikimate 1-carboxyvinyltransferase [Treponema sp.]|nr:3-phosphoshikimate 1-carboxyvinyltransferase [Treponema sp.]
MKAISKRSTLLGEIQIPGSKSQTIRAVLLATLAKGTSIIHNPLPSSDGLSAYAAATLLGATIMAENNTWRVVGTGGQLKAPSDVINTANSGTTTSFVTGICSLIDGYAVVTGDEQIRSRPVRAHVDALCQLGAKGFLTRPDSDCPPLVMGGRIHGGECYVPGSNSQHVSGILVPAALIAKGETVTIHVADPKETSYVQLTIDWMKKFGVTAEVSADHKTYTVKGGQHYKACECFVSGDWSGVAFPLVAAVCTKSAVVIKGVDFSDPQGDKRVVAILQEMGAHIDCDETHGCLHVHGGYPLHGITIDMADIPDALPALAVAACYASGTTTFTTIAHIRQKESDRVAVMTEELQKCGATVSFTEEKMTIVGGKALHGSVIDCHKDHRIAMAMTVCGMYADGEMYIDNAECANVSFPDFYDLLRLSGADISIR